MKILVVTQYFYPETFRVNSLCEAFVKKGHEVEVLTGYPQYPQGKLYDGYGFKIPYDTKWKGIKIHRVKVLPRGKTPIGLLLNCLTFVQQGNRWVKKCKTKFDAVYVFEVSPVTVGLPAVQYKKKFGTPIYFNVQDLWPENVEVIMGIHNKIVIGCINKIVDKIYTSSDIILCASQGFVENIASRGVPKEKLVFWPQFCDYPEIETLKKPVGFQDDKFNIVFTGNIGQAQSIDLLLKALHQIRNPKVKCFIVGDGRALESLKNLREQLGIQDYVEFVGRVSEKEANEYVYYGDLAYISLMDNKVFHMTIPAKFQTYLACGAPILGAVSGECSAIIEENNCGICVEKTPESIGAGIEQLLQKTPEELETLKQASRNCFETHYRKDKLVDKLEALMIKGMK